MEMVINLVAVYLVRAIKCGREVGLGEYSGGTGIQ